MKIILALDSFKGCLTSEEVEAAFARPLASKGIETLSIPMSDGGEGMLEAFITALHGCKIQTRVHDPLMRPIEACYGMTHDGTAIIETAKACGLMLMKQNERNPLTATTYGVGELIADALKRGCRKFVVGLGGSGTSDAGTGMLQALADKLTCRKDIDEVATNPILAPCSFLLASDVRNPLWGIHGAAQTFGPQKGATAEMVVEIDRRARLFAEKSAHKMGRDCSQQPGAGAAGGLGYAFLQYLSATLTSGADLLLDWTDFDHLLETADMIITGEGRADRQTLMGKLPERILRRAQKKQCPVWLIAGQATESHELTDAGFSRVDSLTPINMDLQTAIRPDMTRKNIEDWVARNF